VLDRVQLVTKADPRWVEVIYPGMKTSIDWQT